MSETQWTVPLVQSHAQAAVAIELYTLPFYLTAMTSIQDVNNAAYTNILSVSMEEMLHLELAANLCLALGTTPNFQAPVFGTPIPFFDPDDPETNHHALINAVLGPLNETTLQTMLDIETPEEFEPNPSPDTPNYPYASIGQFYDALLYGITSLNTTPGWSWSTTNQQTNWGLSYETIGSLTNATSAITTITEQGEGKGMSPVPQPPFEMAQFPIPVENQLPASDEPMDPSPLNTFAHFGRFVDIQNTANKGGFPAVYPLIDDPTPTQKTAQQNALSTLQTDFATFIGDLNSLWAGENPDWFALMQALLDDATNCWKAGVIPVWTAA